MQRYVIMFELEVLSDSPEHAAMIGRDIMLDPFEAAKFDVHETEWDGFFGEWMPDMEHGWQARYCGNHPAVKPCQMIEWQRLKTEEAE